MEDREKYIEENKEGLLYNLKYVDYIDSFNTKPLSIKEFKERDKVWKELKEKTKKFKFNFKMDLTKEETPWFSVKEVRELKRIEKELMKILKKTHFKVDHKIFKKIS